MSHFRSLRSTASQELTESKHRPRGHGWQRYVLCADDVAWQRNPFPWRTLLAAPPTDRQKNSVEYLREDGVYFDLFSEQHTWDVVKTTTHAGSNG
ncbi:MAG: hypothetical protein KDB23_29045 [Planctomycetales bacterium]|nr:hypothetical protein [Planctomycetales bacterium]